MEKLIPFIQHYQWGSQNHDNLVRSIYLKNNEASYDHEKGKHWAEAWMGTHPNGEALLKSNEEPLSKHINKNLKFLFKVLSIDKCLSIQVHPDKKAAVQLHETNAQNYKDNLPKPEIAIALTELLAFNGFVSKEVLTNRFELFPSIKEYITKDIELNKAFNNTYEENFLKGISAKLLNETEQALKLLIDKIKCELSSIKIETNFTMSAKRAFSQYANDVGLIFIFLMNVIKVPAGHAIFIHPGCIHAYIEGEIVECMAASDNVIRVGLTNKYRDISSFLDYGVFKSTKSSYYKPDTVSKEKSGLNVLEYDNNNNGYFKVYRIFGHEIDSTYRNDIKLIKNSIVVNMGGNVTINGELLKPLEVALIKSDLMEIESLKTTVDLYVATEYE